MYTEQLLEKMKEVSAAAFSQNKPLAIYFHSCFEKGEHATQWRSIVHNEEQLVHAIQTFGVIHSQIPQDHHVSLGITDSDPIPEICSSFIPTEDKPDEN